MNDALAELLLSGKLSEVPHKSLAVYYTLRADVAQGHTVTSRLEKKNFRLVSGMDLHSIARVVGLPETTVSRLIDDLAKRKLLSRETCEAHNTLYILGFITEHGASWLADTSDQVRPTKGSDMSPSEILRLKLEEDRARVKSKRSTLPGDVRKRIKQTLFNEKDTTPNKLQILRHHYNDRYRLKYNKPPDMVTKEAVNPHMLTNKYLSNCIKSSGTLEHAVKAVDFMFDHWEALQGAFGWQGVILINYLGSNKVWRNVLMAMEEGIPKPRKQKPAAEKNAGSRYDEADMTEAPDSGWG